MAGKTALGSTDIEPVFFGFALSLAGSSGQQWNEPVAGHPSLARFLDLGASCL